MFVAFVMMRCADSSDITHLFDVDVYGVSGAIDDAMQHCVQLSVVEVVEDLQ